MNSIDFTVYEYERFDRQTIGNKWVVAGSRPALRRRRKRSEKQREYDLVNRAFVTAAMRRADT